MAPFRHRPQGSCIVATETLVWNGFERASVDLPKLASARDCGMPRSGLHNCDMATAGRLGCGPGCLHWSLGFGWLVLVRVLRRQGPAARRASRRVVLDFSRPGSVSSVLELSALDTGPIAFLFNIACLPAEPESVAARQLILYGAVRLPSTHLPAAYFRRTLSNRRKHRRARMGRWRQNLLPQSPKVRQSCPA